MTTDGDFPLQSPAYRYTQTAPRSRAFIALVIIALFCAVALSMAFASLEWHSAASAEDITVLPGP